jgi:DNA-binding NarL/FixJ family response regulator
MRMTKRVVLRLDNQPAFNFNTIVKFSSVRETSPNSILRLEENPVNCYKIALVDDHAILRRVLRKALCECGWIEVIADVSGGAALLNLLNHLKTLPDMVILDISMPQQSGLELAQYMRDLFPSIKILIFTMHDEQEYVFQAFKVGVNGYLLKGDNTEELFAAINTIRCGQTYRSPLLRT